MAKRPRRRMISGVEYKIEYLDKYDSRLDEEDGVVDLNTKKIYISKSPSTEYYSIPKVLEHECLHALLHERGIRDLDDTFEHVIVEAMVDYLWDHFLED